MRNLSWIIDVLQDLEVFTEMNDMPYTTIALEAARKAAERETHSREIEKDHSNVVRLDDVTKILYQENRKPATD